MLRRRQAAVSTLAPSAVEAVVVGAGRPRRYEFTGKIESLYQSGNWYSVSIRDAHLERLDIHPGRDLFFSLRIGQKVSVQVDWESA